MTTLLEAYDAEMAVDDYVPQSEVTMSMLGRCRRQAAYALTYGQPDRPEGTGSPQANLGSGLHDYLLPRLADRLGGDWEVTAWLDMAGIRIKGSCDLITEDEVIDLKTVSCRWFDVVSGHIPTGNRYQATAYALALGRDKATLLYVNRCNGDRFAESWDPEKYRVPLEDWLNGVMGAPEETPRDERGPGLSMICDSCPFVTECWGPVQENQLPQGIVVNESGGVALALRSYDEARAAEKAAREDKEFWRAALEGTDADDYEAFSLSWSESKRNEFDSTAAKKMLTAAGLPIPTREKTVKSINVRARRD